jgi:hypothetical protein
MNNTTVKITLANKKRKRRLIFKVAVERLSSPGGAISFKLGRTNDDAKHAPAAPVQRGCKIASPY